MNDNISYRIDTFEISLQKMQFTVINRRPKYTKNDKDTVKTEIEKQLFEVFRKYVCPN